MKEEKKSVKVDDDYFDYWRAEGFHATFTPAGLPPPTHFIAVNARGWDDPQDQGDFEGKGDFNDPDVVLLIVKSDMKTLKNIMRQVSKNEGDIVSHIETWNGGLYAIWDYGEYQMIAGMDNGGCDIAQSEVLGLRSKISCCAHYWVNSFRADYFDERDNFRFMDEKSKEFVTLYQAIKERRVLQMNTVGDEKTVQQKSKM